MAVDAAVHKKQARERLRPDELVIPGGENESSSTRGKSLRLNLLLPGKSAERLERLKELTEASSYTEVIRNSIRLYEAIVLEYEKGRKVQIVDDKGNPTGVAIF